MSVLYKNNESDDLNIHFDKSEVITIIISHNMNIHYHLSNGEYKILVFNNSNSDVLLNEDGVIENSDVEINYLEFNNYSFVQKNHIVVDIGSTLTINSTYLGSNNKKIDYDLINNSSFTTINISNNVVCLDDADLNLNVVGEIKKGAKASKCFQKSRCLTFGNPNAAKVLPVLKIDENDVEASHSLSSGTIDENVLFYMNSRGLSKKDALSLVLTSYLVPSDDFYSIYEDGENIKEISYQKVKDVCLM